MLPNASPLARFASPLLATLAVALMSSGCADDTVSATDAFVLTDGSAGEVSLDARTLAPCSPAVIGQPCTETGNECGEGGTCLLTSGTRGGVCACPCTVADEAAGVGEVSGCPDPDAQVCASVTLSLGTTGRFCLQRCQPKLGSNDCVAPLACRPDTSSMTGHPEIAACFFVGCDGQNARCPVWLANGCVVGDATACASGQGCIPIVPGATAGRCATSGRCDPISGLCMGHAEFNPTAAIGDTCTADQQCGEYMSCELETDPSEVLGQRAHGAACQLDHQCCGRCIRESGQCEGTCALHARGGYCVVKGCAFAGTVGFESFGCPPGSSCHRLYPGGTCLKGCALDRRVSCRDGADDQSGDYECRDWRGVFVDGRPVTSDPVCEFGDAMRCGQFAPDHPAVGCEQVGRPKNATDMTCRDLAGNPFAAADDPRGFCFDLLP